MFRNEWLVNIVRDRAMGCLLGGAYGDSFGASLEFKSRAVIFEQYPKGLHEPLGFPGCPKGSVTDDTQQALEVARGLVHARRRGGSLSLIREDVWSRLQEWRGRQSSESFNRCPGGTSLSALSHDHYGTPIDPLNHSDSCGAVMRSHPVGLYAAGEPEIAFDIGCAIGALTHGDPDGYAPAGVSAAIVAQIVQGETFERAVKRSCLLCEKQEPSARRTAQLLRLVMDPSNAQMEIELDSGAQGWNGPETLAMAIHAVRRCPDDLNACSWFAAAHSGDSDSVASIAGAFFGAMSGERGIPRPWNQALEYADELRQRASELIVLE